MEVSVIVLTWNGGSFIEPCLRAVLTQEPPPSEVIVVDNASTDGTSDLIAEHFPGVQLIRNSRNLGFAAGNNVGLRVATGDTIVLLNQDTRAHPGFLAALAATFDDPAAGIVGAKLLYPDGTIQHAGGYLYGPRGETGHLGRCEPDDGRFEEMNQPEFVTGAALAIRRATLEQIGLLDEGFAPAYYEDVDWCFRARAAGSRVVYQPQAKAVHYESTTTALDSHRHKYALNHGRVRFLYKHRSSERLLREFGPAELAWVSGLDRGEEVMGARRAYLTTLLGLPGILAFRGSSQAESEALFRLLADLRAGAIVGLEALCQSSSSLPAWPEEPLPNGVAARPEALADAQADTRRQQPPIRKGVVDSLLRLWRAIRYLNVLPDLVNHLWQHEEVLRQHEELLSRLQVQARQQERILLDEARDISENIRELNALAECVARREIALSAGPHAADGTESTDQRVGSRAE
jgi:GT2 family glycosyltransferase